MNGWLLFLLILTITSFGLAIYCRLIYERNLKKRDFTSRKLDRLVMLEGLYTFIGGVLLTILLAILGLTE